MTKPPRLDFADWLSPILVKELRQGMRARAFMLSFLILQALMLIVVIVGLATASRQADTTGISAFFWTMVGLPVLLIMPFSGLSAVSREMKANTLELIFLTHLSARRIIIGKWLALVSQIALLVCAVLPYAVLRYFLGGINISSELITLGAMLLASALLTGVAVGISPYDSKAMRVLLTLGAAMATPVIFGFIEMLTMGIAGGGRGFFFTGVIAHGPMLKWWVALILLCVILLLLMLEVGAGKIAPPAENHAWLKRTIGFVLVLLPIVFTRDANERGGFTFFVLALLSPICIAALCERVHAVPSIYRPFLRFGMLGRMIGRVFYPGWPSGFVFTLIAFAATLFLLWTSWSKWTDEQQALTASLALYSAVLLPAALARIFFPRARNPFVIQIGFHIFGIVLAVLATILDATLDTGWRTAACAFPTSALMLTITNGGDTEQGFALIASVVWLVISILILAMTSRLPWREIRTLEALASIQKTSAPDAVAQNQNRADTPNSASIT